MSLCAFVISVLLCGSVRKRMQAARWEFYLSQIFTDEQKPFCEQGEPTNAVKRRQKAQSLSANHQHLTINTQHPTMAERLCDMVGLMLLCALLYESFSLSLHISVESDLSLLSKQREVHAAIASVFDEVGMSGEIIVLTMFKDK